MNTFLEMLTYMRPEGSKAQKAFCNRFLKPVFGKPDQFGNYILSVGVKPNICFTAHHDTVHREGGRQALDITDNNITAPLSNCLGADCTTGVYIMLEMIKAGVSGLYVVHAGEEIGCVGSRALVESSPDWLGQLDAVISFDRRATDSIVTHQMGVRTCSDAFAESLAGILALDMRPDDSGSYTDSNEYQYAVSECTNISVGYYGQHGKSERQDIAFLETLIAACVGADWSGLVFSRPVTALDEFWGYDSTGDKDMQSIVEDYPDKVADLLEALGYDAAGLLADLDLQADSHWRY